jgi:hypothetical protein
VSRCRASDEPGDNEGLSGARVWCKHPGVRLEDLPKSYADRVSPAKDPASWTSRCISPHASQWLAWNVCEDFWYRTTDLDRVRAAIDAVDASGTTLRGPDLLIRCVSALQRLRVMSSDERDRLPTAAVTHILGTRFRRRYALASGWEWAEGSLPGELDPNLAPGMAVRVTPRPPFFRWLTFEVKGTRIPKDPDDVLRRLGLDWKPIDGTVVRVEVPIDTLRSGGALFMIPILFDVIHDSPHPLTPDWRARPEREHRVDEPWGHARDMQHGGAALPEVIADIASAGEMAAEILGVATQDWSMRPYLGGSAPR